MKKCVLVLSWRVWLLLAVSLRGIAMLRCFALFGQGPASLISRLGPLRRRGAVAVARRDLLGGQVAVAVTQESSIAEGATSLSYTASTVLVDGQTIPVAVWYPPGNKLDESQGDAAAESPYSYRISIAKIFRMLLGVALPSFLAYTFLLPCRRRVVRDARFPDIKNPPLVVFAHGYLGSRFDMLHLAERLTSQGFVVAAPEFAESLSASFEPTEGTTRGAIMDATLRMLKDTYQVGKIGLIGHSAGGGTVASISGNFDLGRVAVAGGGFGYAGSDPLLVVMSQGDCLCRRRWPDILAASESAVVFKDSQGAKELAKLAPASFPMRSALLFSENEQQAAPSPSHISFLDPRSNDAMVKFLSPLLPLARLLGVPVLDFDVYQQNVDSEPTAEAVLPVVTRFFESRL